MLFIPDISSPSPSRRLNASGHEVIVFDRWAHTSTMRQLYEFLRSTQYRWNCFDSADNAHSVRWKAELALSRGALPFFSDVERFVREITLRPGLRLRRVYANFNVYGEVHYPHVDGANIVTAIYFANKLWRPSWSGETVFFDKDEPAFVVAPKPGRLMVFDGRVTHRGSPPTRDCFEPRLSLVFKFAFRPTGAKPAVIRKKPKRARPSFYSKVIQPMR